MTARSGAGGVTLVELLVVLVLLGIMAGVVGLTLHTARPISKVDPISARINNAADSATRSGHRVTITLQLGPRVLQATAFPAGRVVADSALAVDALTGGLQ